MARYAVGYMEGLRPGPRRLRGSALPKDSAGGGKRGGRQGSQFCRDLQWLKDQPCGRREIKVSSQNCQSRTSIGHQPYGAGNPSHLGEAVRSPQHAIRTARTASRLLLRRMCSERAQWKQRPSRTAVYGNGRCWLCGSQRVSSNDNVPASWWLVGRCAVAALAKTAKQATVIIAATVLKDRKTCNGERTGRLGNGVPGLNARLSDCYQEMRRR